MRTTVVPSQITTVEDKIAGNLNLTQIFLLITPVFGTTLLYILPPTPMSLGIFKGVIITLISVVSISLAVRVKGRLVLEWLIVMSRYFVRPRLYLFNKNSTTNRRVEKLELPKRTTKKITQVTSTVSSQKKPHITPDYVSLFRGTSVALRYTNKGLVAVKSI